MNLVKTSLLSFIATAVKVLSGLVINKALAVYVGPAGLAIVGQFQNFLQIALTLAQGALNSGVTKYVAEYSKEDEKFPGILSTSLRISFYCSLTVSVVILGLSPWLSSWLMKSNEYTYVFVLLAITLSLFVLNNLLLSILNGLKEIKTFILINIIQSVYALVFTSLLIVFLGTHGALIALATNQSVILFVVLLKLKNHPAIKIDNFKLAFDPTLARKLFSFVAMGLVSLICTPVTLLLIRNLIGEKIGWDEAGYWQAIWYISSTYLMVVTTALGIYFLPTLSELKSKKDLQGELFRGYLLIIPTVAAMGIVIFFLRDFIISLLFTENFSAMRELFKWQLIGDVFKIASWLLSYLLLAKAQTKKFIMAEIFFSVLFTTLSFTFLTQFGLIGVTYSYALSYAVYLGVMLFAVRPLLFEIKDAS